MTTCECGEELTGDDATYWGECERCREGRGDTSHSIAVPNGQRATVDQLPPAVAQSLAASRASRTARRDFAIFILRHYEFSPAEIAELFGMHRANAARSLERTPERIRKRVSDPQRMLPLD